MSAQITKRKNMRKFQSQCRGGGKKEREREEGKGSTNVLLRGIKNDRGRRMKCEKERKYLDDHGGL
jgi:hypothetical protein